MKLELHHYLSFNGNCEEAFGFYRDALGGHLHLTRYDDMPPPEGQPDHGPMNGKIMHARLVGTDFTLMGSDIPEERFVPHNPMMQLSANVHSVEDAEALFAKLSVRGPVFMPLQKTFWAERFGMCLDPFGFSWMVNFDLPQPQAEAPSQA